jgi:hypothetical protein
MLTYDRLLAHMHRLSASLPSHFEGERLSQISNAIKSVILACKRGLTGDQETLSPGQLKHWVERKIQAIHELFDNPLSLKATTPNKRKRTSNDDAPAAKKVKRDEDGEVRRVAAALLALCSSSPPSTPPHPPITHDMRLIAAGRKVYTPFPDVDRKRRTEPTFLAGVTYAMQNVGEHGMGITKDMEQFTEYVRAELGIESVGERRSDEVEAAKGLLGMIGVGRAGGRAGIENAGQAAGQAGGHTGDENDAQAARHGAAHLGGQGKQQCGGNTGGLSTRCEGKSGSHVRECCQLD